MTPFLYLCKNGEINDVKNARPKIENINLQNGDGKSALHLAIVNRRNDVARFLIDEGADVNLTDYDGMTAFTSACVTATIDVVKKMRPNIADINFQCKLRRNTALHYAIINKNEDIARFLIDEGADINLPDCDGKSAFLCACETVKNVDIVKKMRLNIADINLQRNVDKKTALHFAVINKDKDLFQFLIDEGTDVNLADDDGQTAFIWACKSADIDIVRKIRPFVTNINLQCKLYKRSALHLAVVNKNEEIVLIDEGADINVTDNGGMTAFLWACRLADIDTVRRMRPNVADINIQCNLYKKSALHLALENNNRDIVKFLIDEGADVGLIDCDGMTAFHCACKSADIDVVKKMRPKVADINLQRNFDKKCALHLAFTNENKDIAQFLIDEGADVNLADEHGQTAFIWACKSADIDIVRKMRPFVANINLQCKLYKKSALHLALMNKNKEIARFLIDEGADINLTDNGGMTAFLWACKLADIDTVRKMRPNVADINIQCNFYKKSALHLALENNNRDIGQFLIDEGADIDLLDWHGADVNLADEHGQTAFIWACKSADIDIVRKMRPFVANINLQCKLYKKSALHLALMNKNKEIARFLIDEGADINLTDNGGMTAFLWACKLADIDTVRKMRPNVADINIQCNFYKKSALHLALENNNKDIGQFLIDEGADIDLLDWHGMTAFHSTNKSAYIDFVK
ncbi:hypothetical protein FQR65_LT12397 [Abscondita terminalis]|nr:hypothetical protein FQR65_LT12397 [Abscondita terminalis]